MDSETKKPTMTKTINLRLISEPKEIAEVALGIYVSQCIKGGSAPDPKAFMGLNKTTFKDAEKYEYAIEVDGKKQDWVVVDSTSHKFVINRDGSYTQIFNKTTGFNARMGKTVEDDPRWCPLGNEILDLEISQNGCPKVGGASCKFCYKNNTDKPATNMTLDQFKTIVGRFPRNLSQIALGITGVQTNPDFVEMLRWLREDMGIVPNYTLSGADLNDEIFEATLKYCGRVAVSVYETDKNLCYNTIKRFNEKSPDFCNMHIILSDSNLPFVNEVLDDIESGKVPGLRNIVFLRCKPVGRASKLPCTLSMETLDKVITRCEKIGIGFGFDSCSCGLVSEYYKARGMNDLVKYMEPCEGFKLSFYVNALGEGCLCSFCEHVPGFKRFNMLAEDFDFHKMWIVEGQRFRNMDTANHCPCFK